MLPSKRTLPFLLAIAATGCGGNPSAPTNATVTISGTVSQPGGAPVAGVGVAAPPGGSAITDASGKYSFTRSANSQVYDLTASKAGYETRRLSGPFLPGGPVINLTIAPVFLIAAGATAAFTMLPDEPGYPSPDSHSGPPDCTAPCRLIRVITPMDRGGAVTIAITARDPARRLQVFLDAGNREICCQREYVLESNLPADAAFVFHVRFSDSLPLGSNTGVDIVTTFRAQ